MGMGKPYRTNTITFYTIQRKSPPPGPISDPGRPIGYSVYPHYWDFILDTPGETTSYGLFLLLFYRRERNYFE
jgi:hypothetical protein